MSMITTCLKIVSVETINCLIFLSESLDLVLQANIPTRFPNSISVSISRFSRFQFFAHFPGNSRSRFSLEQTLMTNEAEVPKRDPLSLECAQMICSTGIYSRANKYFLDFSKFSHLINLIYDGIQSPDHILENCVKRIWGHFFNPEFHLRTLCAAEKNFHFQ